MTDQPQQATPDTRSRIFLGEDDEVGLPIDEATVAHHRVQTAQRQLSAALEREATTQAAVDTLATALAAERRAHAEEVGGLLAQIARLQDRLTDTEPTPDADTAGR